ncbi:kelch motif family protein [Stylonychia lemnae]|uniref:Kelch motif family protein n=1 Tax=Stylonychia lemnae TaxID=5949 RepID=A0A077ZV02_STYLE|nr:kelch motif family protein [Stylonychia lemnae]|eukprot:CDW73130.1 kelch motif family protein [Stylonychia lemnae]
MECPSCQKSYDSFSSGDINVIPRILSKCGHSFCHSCIVKLYDGKQVICPLCKSINISDSISNYTKNLALLQILVENQYCSSPLRQTSLGLIEPFEITESQQSSGQSNRVQGFKLDLNSTLQSISLQNKNGYQQCQEHTKPIEAFCWSEKQPLCIDCLLQQPMHKQHDVSNIEKSASRQEESLRQTQDKVQVIKQQIQNQQDSLGQQKNDLDDEESIQVSKFTTFFNELKESIEMRSREAYLEIQSKIESKRREIIEQEQKLKDFLNEMNAVDFQILSVQLGPINSHIEQLMAQMTREQQATEMIDKVSGFMKVIELQQNEGSVQSKFDYKREIQIVQKMVDELHIKHIGPLPIQLPLLQKQESSTLALRKSTSKAYKELTARELAIQRSSKKNASPMKEVFSSRRIVVAQEKQTLALNQSQSQLSNLNNNKIRTSQIKDEKQKPINTAVRERRQSMTARTAAAANQTQKLDKTDIQLRQQRNMHKTPLKKIEEVAAQGIKTGTNFRRNASRAAFDKNISQPATSKASNATNRTLQTVSSVKDVNFEQCLRQTLLAQSNTILASNSQAVLNVNNSRSYLNRLGQKSSTSNIYEDNYASNTSAAQSDLNYRKASANLPLSSTNALNSSITSKMHIIELQNRSVEESEHEENSSFTSILRLAPDGQNIQSIAQVQPHINILIRDETQKSLHSSSSNNQFIVGMGTMQAEQDQDFKMPHPQSAGLRNFSQTKNQRWLDQTAIEQIGVSGNNRNQQNLDSENPSQNSRAKSQAKYPSLREQRNNIKESKRQSAIHQIESEEWLSRQAQIVQSITQARQGSSRRDHSRQSNLAENSMIISINSKIDDSILQNNKTLNNQFIVTEHSSQDKILESTLKEDEYDDMNHNIESDMTSPNNDQSIEQFYQSNHFVSQSYKPTASSLMLARKQLAQKKKQQEKVEENSTHVVGIISNHQNQDDKFFQVEMFDSQNNIQTIGMEVANFKYQLGEKFKVVPDPRQVRNYLLVGGKVNGQFTQQVLQFDSRLQIVEESDIADIPLSFTEAQYFGVQSAVYQTDTNYIPLLCMAYSKQSSDNGDSQEYINVSQLEILSYDFSSNVWDQIPPIPYQLQDISPLADFQFIIHCNSIYILGGQQDGQVLKSVMKFDLYKQEWSRCKDMTYPRINFSAISCGYNGIIVNGGSNGFTAMEYCEAYDHNQDEWHQLPALSIPRMYHTSISIERGDDMNLYVIGGIDFAERLLMNVEIFNLTQLKWMPQVTLNEDNLHNQNKAWYNVNLVKLSL